MHRGNLPTPLLALTLLSTIILTLPTPPASAEPTQTEIEAAPTYVGIAKYYDNRKCAVTSTHDDLAYNTTTWQNCLSTLTAKKLYHTVSIITNASRGNDWNFIQYWLNQGYTEPGSHSRNHVHVPYTGWDETDGTPRISYEWQINGSKNDIIGNLTLPTWWTYQQKEYVYTWIEPYGTYDNTVRQWLGQTHYLTDRSILTGAYDFANWDTSKNLFQRVGYTVEMGTPPWGGDSSVTSLNNKFNTAYNNGKIYHFMTHPSHVNWTQGSYADQHLDYISNRKDVWYVSFGLLYLYRWVQTRNIVNGTSRGSGESKIFQLSINATNHQNYGIAYPITHIFDVPANWADAHAYYRYLETDPWTMMENKTPQDFYNGITASRFDFTNHKAYVSVSFSNTSHKIYLQLGDHTADVAAVNVTTSKTIVGQGYPTSISVTVENHGINPQTFNITIYANTTEIARPTVTLPSGSTTTISITWNTTGFAKGNYTISAHIPPVPAETDIADNSHIDGTVRVAMVGDMNGDNRVNIMDLATIGVAYGSNPNSQQWNPNADIDNNGIVNITDLAICARNYGKTDP